MLIAFWKTASAISLRSPSCSKPCKIAACAAADADQQAGAEHGPSPFGTCSCSASASKASYLERLRPCILSLIAQSLLYCPLELYTSQSDAQVCSVPPVHDRAVHRAQDSMQRYCEISTRKTCPHSDFWLFKFCTSLVDRCRGRLCCCSVHRGLRRNDFAL